MPSGSPTRIIAASCGLAGFALAIVFGLLADNPSEDVLFRGLVAMCSCNLLGWVIGAIAERTVRDSVSSSPAAADVNRISTDRDDPALRDRTPSVTS